MNINVRKVSQMDQRQRQEFRKNDAGSQMANAIKQKPFYYK